LQSLANFSSVPLFSREKTGKGQKIDVSMMESSLQFISLYAGIYMSTGKLPERGNELLSGKLANYNIYKTKEGRFVFLGALEERFFRTFLRQIGKEHLMVEGKNLEELAEEFKETLEDFFLSQSFTDLKPLFENPDCCLTPIQNLSEVLQDEHLLDRGSVFKKNHPVYGEYFQFASPFRFFGNFL
jgi:alpha-methylacyl-CoA racemase